VSSHMGRTAFSMTRGNVRRRSIVTTCRPGIKSDVARTSIEACFASAGLGRTVLACRRGESIFARGDVADSLMYVRTGVVKLSVSGRREAIVGLLGSGDFFGDECLAGHPSRTWDATALTQSTALVIDKAAMVALLRTEPVLAGRFMAHLLARRMRVEFDLIDQLQSSCEQRLARTLMLLAGYGHRGTRQRTIPKISQTTLAGIVGSPRARINFFLQKFKSCGFIKMDGSLTVYPSLLGVVSPCLRGHIRDRSGPVRRGKFSLRLK
jgi:CRP/FNR family transcriptional regulator, cyclic AMP receptor protein